MIFHLGASLCLTDGSAGSLAKCMTGMLWIGHYGLCFRMYDSHLVESIGGVRRSAWAASALVWRLVEINLQSICRDHSQFVQHENIRMISTFSVLTSFRQVLVSISGHMYMYWPSQFSTRCPLSKIYPLDWGDVHNKFNVASRGEKILEWSAQGTKYPVCWDLLNVPLCLEDFIPLWHDTLLKCRKRWRGTSGISLFQTCLGWDKIASDERFSHPLVSQVEHRKSFV